MVSVCVTPFSVKVAVRPLVRKIKAGSLPNDDYRPPRSPPSTLSSRKEKFPSGRVTVRRCEAETGWGRGVAHVPTGRIGKAVGLRCFALGRKAKPASDRVNYRFVRSVLRPGAFRDRLTTGTYVSMDPNDITGVLEDAFVKVTEAEDIEARFIKAGRKGAFERRLDRDAIDDAVAAGVLNSNEAGIMRAADEATDRVVKVDDFQPGELGLEEKRAAAE